MLSLVPIQYPEIQLVTIVAVGFGVGVGVNVEFVVPPLPLLELEQATKSITYRQVARINVMCLSITSGGVVSVGYTLFRGVIPDQSKCDIAYSV